MNKKSILVFIIIFFSSVLSVPIEVILTQAEEEDDKAQIYLGSLYERGEEIEQDYAKAIYWYQRAIKNNNYNAYTALAYLISHGHGVKRNYKKAAELYTEAANHGDMVAQHNLAVFYSQGLGVPHDEERATYWFLQSAKRGYTPAQAEIGVRLYDGKGIPRDYKEAAYWLKRAAEKDEIKAAYMLGNLCYRGLGIKQSYQNAAHWYYRAAKKGHLLAQKHLAYMHTKGLGVSKDQTRADFWYKKASRNQQPLSYLPLPADLKGKPIYYVNTTQIDEWSCVYNALYNACWLETHLGCKNIASEPKLFEDLCLLYLSQLNESMQDASHNRHIEFLAKNGLNLANVGYLAVNKHGQVYLAPISVTFYCSEDATDEEKEAAIQEATIKETQELLITLQKQWDETKNNFCFVHLFCHLEVKGIGHSVLLSAVKDPKNKASLYVFDNMNNPITNNSFMHQYIKFAYDAFNIHGGRAQASPQQITNKAVEEQKYTTKATNIGDSLIKHKSIWEKIFYYFMLMIRRIVLYLQQ